ncbi:MAG TPA: MarR family transcriptional regulator [Terriglobia bacterium]|nr:MarR family transcriptional regulator [Terriglobia bacterium]
MSPRPRSTAGKPAVDPLIRRQAWFRYQLRRFLRFSEQAARASGLTPQQHQLLLGVAGYTGRGWATISELSEFLQARHNAVAGLVERSAGRGLLRKEPGAGDRRFVRVFPTEKGLAILEKLASLHRQELARVRARLLTFAKARPKAIPKTPGA